MELKCHLCGTSVEVESWTEEYERIKAQQEPAYICEACQERVRLDAQNNQRP